MFALLLALPLNGAWISGPEYLAYTDLKSNEPLVITKTSTSEGMDPRQCLLWSREKETGKLSGYSPKRTVKPSEPSGEILSDWLGDSFLTQTPDGLALQRRDDEGNVVESLKADWAKRALRVVAGPDGQRWALLSDGKRLSLMHLNSQYQQPKETPIAESRDFWGSAKILVDANSRKIWVGYAATRPGLVYSPNVARIDFEGKVEAVYQWKEKGLFFDACLDKEFSVLAARDIPSSPYTVPVYSTLESLSPTGEIQKRYEAETNYFIDALVCQPDRLLMIQRSIFGSDGSYLMEWDRVTGTAAKRLFRLPGPARALYACPGFSEGISLE